MKKLSMALVATSMLAAPAAIAKDNMGMGKGKSYAYGQDPKVCLVTFESQMARMSQADAGVVKAQYLPLRIALRKEAENDSMADIYTYNANGMRESGVDFNIAPQMGMTTESTCAYLDSLNDDEDDDDDMDG